MAFRRHWLENDKYSVHFLIGRRVYLRALTKRDLQKRYFDWFNEQQSDIFTDHAMWPNTRSRMEGFLERVTRGGNDLVLAIVVKSNDEHIGNIGLHQINWIHRRAEMAILIGEPGYRNQGYGREAIELLAGYAFNKLNLHRIGLGVLANNVAALRSYKNAGFVTEGRFKEHFFRGGEFFDTVRMRLLREDFVKQSPRKGKWFTLGRAEHEFLRGRRPHTHRDNDSYN